MPKIIENHIEQWVIESLQEKGYSFLTPDFLDPDFANSLRSSYAEVLIIKHLQEAIIKFNPTLSAASIQQVIRDIQNIPDAGDLVSCNKKFQQLILIFVVRLLKILVKYSFLFLRKLSCAWVQPSSSLISWLSSATLT